MVGYFQGTGAAVDVQGRPRVKRGLSIRVFLSEPFREKGWGKLSIRALGVGIGGSEHMLSFWEGIQARTSSAPTSARLTVPEAADPGVHRHEHATVSVQASIHIRARVMLMPCALLFSSGRGATSR